MPNMPRPELEETGQGEGSRSDYYDSLFGKTYSAYMERKWLSRPVARAVWGGDIRPYYESMNAIAAVGPGGRIVDCPCGAGPALRALRPGAGVRYIAADLSPSMLDRAAQRARRRGITSVELVKADASKLPLPSGSADLFLSYWGLHCFKDPPAALAEAARVLAPAGHLVGSCLLRGSENRRQRLLVRCGRGDFGEVGTREDVEAWLTGNGFGESRLRQSGAMLFFHTRLPEIPSAVI
jgi:SAM-dependent methyltransferase